MEKCTICTRELQPLWEKVFRMKLRNQTKLAFCRECAEKLHQMVIDYREYRENETE